MVFYWCLLGLQGKDCDVRDAKSIQGLADYVKANLGYVDIWVRAWRSILKLDIVWEGIAFCICDQHWCCEVLPCWKTVKDRELIFNGFWPLGR